MLSHPAILALLLALAAVVLLSLLWAWRDRSVDFIHRRALGAQTDAVAALMLDRVVPVLVRDGFAMVAQAGHTTVFERRFFPIWTILVAIFLFPVGLLALLARGRETIVIISRDGVLELHGRCGKFNADFVIASADDAATENAPI
jgi:hypothetical protein